MLQRTECPLKKTTLPIFPESKVLSIGSCFAEEIGRKLKYHLLDCSINPAGIAFNPLSLADLWDFQWDERDIFQYHGIWHSLKHHSILSAASREALLNNIERRHREMEAYKTTADLVIVSFGTAYCYRYRKTGRQVANCHKIPQSEFEKKRVDVDEIVNLWSSILTKAKKENPERQYILTVSPVRHLKDGMIENNRSKAILQLAVEELTKIEKVHYFPAYELMLDDLRDYRYYKDDMIHPTEKAVNYIWERFADCFFSEKMISYLKDIGKLVKMLRHRPRFSFGVENQNHIEQIDQQKKRLCAKYPQKAQAIIGLP